MANARPAAARAFAAASFARAFFAFAAAALSLFETLLIFVDLTEPGFADVAPRFRCREPPRALRGGDGLLLSPFEEEDPLEGRLAFLLLRFLPLCFGGDFARLSIILPLATLR